MTETRSAPVGNSPGPRELPRPICLRVCSLLPMIPLWFSGRTSLLGMEQSPLISWGSGIPDGP